MSEHSDRLVQVAELVAPTGWRTSEPVTVSYQNQRFLSGHRWQRVLLEIGDNYSDKHFTVFLTPEQARGWASALMEAAAEAMLEVPELVFKEMGAGI